MELNAEQQQALELMKSGQNVFLRGDAGTGKTAVLNHFIDCDPSRIVSLAPTGLAARNLKNGGMTIHRFLNTLERGFASSRQTVKQYLEAIRCLVIEEISMVRSDLFVRLDGTLRFYTGKDCPFGGIQLVVVGDFYQLPPVVETKERRDLLEQNFGGVFAFEATAWKEAELHNVELRTCHRQTDHEFLDLLRAVRTHADGLDIQLRRLTPYVKRRAPSGSRYLCCYRPDADRLNHCFVERLPTPERIFTGIRKGDYPKSEWPAPMHLKLKSGMRALITANDPDGAYANGDIGEIVIWNDKAVWVDLQRGTRIAVRRHTWFNNDYQLTEQDGVLQLIPVPIGKFVQFPIVPAYAMTIHKAQGQTLDRVHLELGTHPCFASGQLYTALSRVRSLDSLSFSRPLCPADVIVDNRVQRFYGRL